MTAEGPMKIHLTDGYMDMGYRSGPWSHATRIEDMVLEDVIDPVLEAMRQHVICLIPISNIVTWKGLQRIYIYGDEADIWMKIEYMGQIYGYIYIYIYIYICDIFFRWQTCTFGWIINRSEDLVLEATRRYQSGPWSHAKISEFEISI